MIRFRWTLTLTLAAAAVCSCKQYGGPIPPDPSPKFPQGAKPGEPVPPPAPQQSPAPR